MEQKKCQNIQVSMSLEYVRDATQQVVCSMIVIVDVGLYVLFALLCNI